MADAHDPKWLEGYEAAKEQAARVLENAASEGFPHNASLRTRTAKWIRTMQPPPALPGSGEVIGAEPFPGLIASIKPKRDNGTDGDAGYQTEQGAPEP